MEHPELLFISITMIALGIMNVCEILDNKNNKNQ